MKNIILYFCLILLIKSEIINKDITRSIDASTHVVREMLTIKASGIGKGPYEINYLHTPAYVDAESSSGKPLSVTQSLSNPNKFFVDVTSDGDKDVTFEIYSVFMDIIHPYPKEIEQSKQQLVFYEDSLYVLSPYFTKSQNIIVAVYNKNIEKVTPKEFSQISANSVKFGPFNDISSDFVETPKFYIHYENHFPFATITTCTKEIEVSHWGNIAVEEVYEMEHTGAKLKGGFSRLDFQVFFFIFFKFLSKKN